MDAGAITSIAVMDDQPPGSSTTQPTRLNELDLAKFTSATYRLQAAEMARATSVSAVRMAAEASERAAEEAREATKALASLTAELRQRYGVDHNDEVDLRTGEIKRKQVAPSVEMKVADAAPTQPSPPGTRGAKKRGRHPAKGRSGR